MKTGKHLFILYFYLLKKIQKIEPSTKNTAPNSIKEKRFRFSLIIKDIGIAALISILFYQTMVFLHTGHLIFPNFYALIEMALLFTLLLFLFWSHYGISSLMESPYFTNTNRIIKTITEIFLVILVTFLLVTTIVKLPTELIFPPEAIVPAKIRVGFVVTTTLSLFFYFFVERERSKRRLQERMLHSTRLQKENFQAQLQSLKNQVNPHFLFNSLNVLSSLIRKNESQAREFIYRLAKVYRSFLDYSHEQLVPLKKEMELTEAYIYLLSTRFGDSLQFNVNISDAQKDLLLPPGSLQMLVENAIKHNGSTRKKPLTIEIYSKENYLIVKNNLQPRLEKVTSTKTGLQNIRRRYKFLSDEEVEFTKTEKEFIAKLPLLKIDTYENSNY